VVPPDPLPPVEEYSGWWKKATVQRFGFAARSALSQVSCAEPADREMLVLRATACHAPMLKL
jgi:hypothetical protein